MPVTIVPTSLRYKDGNQFVSADCLKGETGDTPVITAEKVGKQTSVMVNGTVIATILDGQDGSPGHSPVITASKSGKTTTISVDGEPIATILDGEDGSGGDVIDDTAGPFTVDKTWSASKLWSDFAGKMDKNDVKFDAISMNRVPNSTVGTQSIAIGTAQSAAQGAIASGANSVAVGAYVQATGDKAIAIGNNANASGLNSTAIGGMVTASGNFSFAHGSSAAAQGTNSTAEGYGTIASGVDSHAEGSYTTASGNNAHSQGASTTASGDSSSAAGGATVANHAFQNVFGFFNVPDPSSASASEKGNYIEIVGNGENPYSKSNARTLDWNGNERLKGNIYVGCNADGTGGTMLEPVVFATDAHTREIFATE